MQEVKQFYENYKKLFDLALYDNIHKKYRRKTITKKSGGKRKLLIPPATTDKAQKLLNPILQTLYTPPKPVHGFIKSNEDNVKSIISNAKQHVNKYIVINVDIENFFDTINFGRVRGLFLSKPFNLEKELATKIAQLTTYDNKIPQGASTSPIISNFICKRMDHELIKFSKKNSLTYTRYADDMTFSSYKKDLDIDYLLTELTSVVNSNGFDVNTDKTRAQLSKHSQVVTGLTVNKKVNVSRKFVRQIRSMLHSWNEDGLEIAAKKHFDNFNKQKNKYTHSKEDSFKSILLGKISFLGQVRGYSDSIYIKFNHTFFLQESDFYLTKNLKHFEYFDLYNMNTEEALLLFTQINRSLLVFTEGVTDIIYIKEALKFFKKADMYKQLDLRFCYFGGYGDIIKFHRILYDKSVRKMENFKDLNIVNIRKCVLPYLKNDSKFCFVLDADEIGIEKHFEKHETGNHFLLDIKNKGYVEKLIDKKIIIDLVKKYGYKIDTNRAELSSETKKKLLQYLKKKNLYEDINSVSSYIAYGKKILEKTNLAKQISKLEDVDYTNFKDLFVFLERINHYYIQPEKLCSESIY